jgi:hypothetical protein
LAGLLERSVDAARLASTNCWRTEVEVNELFRHLFGKPSTPPITAVAMQMNTKDTQGSAAAFIRSIEFVGE